MKRLASIAVLLALLLLPLCCLPTVGAVSYLFPRALATDGKKLYVATDEGLLVWDRSFSVLKPPYLPSARVTAVNGQTALAVGTDNGAAYANGQGFRVITSSDGLPSSMVTAVGVCGTRLLVGTPVGLAVYVRGSRARPLLYRYPDLPHNYVSSIACSGDNAFIGTPSGLVLLKDKSLSKVLSVPINEVVVTGNNVWVATSQGVYRMDVSGKVLKIWDANSGLYSSNVTAITTYGAGAYAYDGQSIVHLPDLRKLGVSEVTDLVYMNGKLYIAARAGLYSTDNFVDLDPLYQSRPYTQDAFYNKGSLVEVRDNALYVDQRPVGIAGVIRAFPGDMVTVVTFNQVYLLDTTNLNRWTVSSGAFTEIAPYSIEGAYYSQNGMLYVAGYGRLFAIHRATGTYQKASAPYYTVRRVWSDGKYVYVVYDRSYIIANSVGSLVRSGTFDFYVRDVYLGGGVYLVTDAGIKYASSLWSEFNNFSSLDALKFFRGSTNWATGTFGLAMLSSPAKYYHWGNGLPEVPKAVLSDNPTHLLLSGRASLWNPEALLDWTTLDGKEEASKLQAIGILKGFRGYAYPQRVVTYQELVAFYVRLKAWQIKTTGATSIKADEWAKPYISTLWLKGYRLDIDYRQPARRSVVATWLPELAGAFDADTITRRSLVKFLYALLPY